MIIKIYDKGYLIKVLNSIEELEQLSELQEYDGCEFKKEVNGEAEFGVISYNPALGESSQSIPALGESSQSILALGEE